MQKGDPQIMKAALCICLPDGKILFKCVFLPSNQFVLTKRTEY